MTGAEDFRELARRFARIAGDTARWTLRLIEEETRGLAVRQDVLLPPRSARVRGALVTVYAAGGHGYAATADLGETGLRDAHRQAVRWAEASATCNLVPDTDLPLPGARGAFRTPVEQPWQALSLEDKIALLHDACRGMRVDDRIVERTAQLAYRRRTLWLASSTGAEIYQEVDTITPTLAAVASDGHRSQFRTCGGALGARQGGLERLGPAGFPREAPRVADEALALLAAPDCPSGRMDIVLMPSQMALQIHESIGHPLELDRILGDERNYAGTSFVTPAMFGSYAYGSPLLNVTFDPGVESEVASYAYDDEGTPAARQYLIRDGILLRPLGSAVSQARSGLPGVANARASDWFRPAIDRMANLNVEPGDQTLDELVAGIEHGVLMDTNSAWSIDDSRNKFQFGCELGRLIRDGQLGGLVRTPNYRGISATFWRSLDGVGGMDTYAVEGVSNCGKGEPNQLVQVGHASPACRFRAVEVFGEAG